jgi:hypothetical protein
VKQGAMQNESRPQMWQMLMCTWARQRSASLRHGWIVALSGRLFAGIASSANACFELDQVQILGTAPTRRKLWLSALLGVDAAQFYPYLFQTTTSSHSVDSRH